MIVLAIIITICVIAFSVLVLYANSMRSSPGDFRGKRLLIACWTIVAVFWVAWALN